MSEAVCKLCSGSGYTGLDECRDCGATGVISIVPPPPPNEKPGGEEIGGRTHDEWLQHRAFQTYPTLATQSVLYLDWCALISAAFDQQRLRKALERAESKLRDMALEFNSPNFTDRYGDGDIMQEIADEARAALSPATQEGKP